MYYYITCKVYVHAYMGKAEVSITSLMLQLFAFTDKNKQARGYHQMHLFLIALLDLMLILIFGTCKNV